MRSNHRLQNRSGWIRTFAAHFSRNLQNALLAAAVVLVAAVAVLSVGISRENDELARENSYQMVEDGLQGLEERLLSLTRDHALWTEFYDAILADDGDWIFPNVASQERPESDISVIISPDGGSDFGWRSDIEEEPPISGIVPADVLELLHEQLDAVPVTDRNAYSAFARLDGDIWLLVMSRVVPWEGIAPDTPDSAIPRLVMGKC